MYVWYHWGFGFLLFLAGLQGVPRELYEAASIDGAGAWGRFRFVTWPQLIPVTTIVSVLTLLGALQIFGTVQVLTNGGPGYLTEVPTLRIYKEGFQFHRFGVAAAMSVVFGAILIALSLVQIWLGRRSDGEGGEMAVRIRRPAPPLTAAPRARRGAIPRGRSSARSRSTACCWSWRSSPCSRSSGCWSARSRRSRSCTAA